jgi:hypothetical protein
MLLYFTFCNKTRGVLANSVTEQGVFESLGFDAWGLKFVMIVFITL